MENLRELLYPLGFLSSIAFTLRFLLQWISSEKHQRSMVTPLFWQISFVGNLLLFIHSFIQIQFHVCLVQACNGVIAWRNLNLMSPPDKQYKLLTVVTALGTTILTVTALFAIQSFFLSDTAPEWFRTPVKPWGAHSPTEIPLVWHMIGFLGILLFNSRFWIQWWGSEVHRSSYLGPAFWWLSLAGAILSIIYFSLLGDIVNLVGPLFGLIPYIRNLMLIHQTNKKTTPT